MSDCSNETEPRQIRSDRPQPREISRVNYKTRIERVRGLDGAPRHQFLWDVTVVGGAKRIIGCGTVRSRSDALQKAHDTIERAEKARLIRTKLAEALRVLPQSREQNNDLRPTI